MNTLLRSTMPTLLAIAASIGGGGCALTSKSEAATFHYYALDGVSQRARPRAEAPRETGPGLRLGRVAASGHLEDKIVYRSSEHELGFYDEHRWSEEPAEFLERALARELFEARGLSRVVAGRAPTLEVELIAFEEIKKPKHVARVELIVVLHDEQRVGLQETLRFEKPLPDDEEVGVLAEALSEAMKEAVDAVAKRVEQRLDQEQAKAASIEPPAAPPETPAPAGTGDARAPTAPGGRK
jgi:cholesterol transport system auxiliary component